MARALGQQARRATATGAGAPAPVDAGADRLGPFRHPRQPAPRAGRAAAPRQRQAGAGQGGQGPARRHPAAAEHRALPLGRSSRPAHAAAGGRRDRFRRDYPGVHQYPLAVGNLVSGAAGCAAGLGRIDRPAPRLTRTRGARLGRTGPQAGRAQGRGLHLQPGSGRGLPAGRASFADRLAQGRGAADAARRPLRTRAGANLAGHPGAHPQRGGGGSCRRPGGHRRASHRGPQRTASPARRAGAAPGEHGPGRRLPPG